MESWVPPLCCCTGKAEARSLMDSAQLLDRLCRPQGLTTSSTLCPFISPQWSWMRAETHVSTWAYWDTVGGRKRYAGWAPLGLDDARGGGSTCWTLLFFLPHPSILVRESEHHLLLPGVGWKISCLSVLLLPPSREIKVPPPASAEQETGYRPSLVDTAERVAGLLPHVSVWWKWDKVEDWLPVWPAGTTGAVAYCNDSLQSSISWL